MLFNSLEFLIFFPIVFSVYLLLPNRFRWIFLLICSYYFYICWKETYILLIGFSTVIDYFCGLKMGNLNTKEERKPYLLISLFTNLALLFSFKYFNFFSDSLNALIGNGYGDGPVPILDVVLPVGISFYTFQTLSYSIDIYKGRMQPEQSFWRFALYVSFFPQLVAGPIERAKRLLPQFYQEYKFDLEKVKYGFSLMLWGFFKKMVIADRLGEYVGVVYSQPEQYEFLQVWLANGFFILQIYCDFSGYSDIAIGMAAMMGYKLMLNFRQPLFAQDVQEFWSRWHLSLTTWFRDYFYAELGGKKKGKLRWYLNMWLVFFVIGVWHGAAWSFVLFGAIHGLFVVLTVILRPTVKRWKERVGILKFSGLNTFLNIFTCAILVSFTSIFFRGSSLENIWQLMKASFSLGTFDYSLNLFGQPSDFYIALVALFLMLFVEYLQWKDKFEDQVKRMPRVLKYVAIGLGVVIFVLFAKFKEQDFIYFQF